MARLGLLAVSAIGIIGLAIKLDISFVAVVTLFFVIVATIYLKLCDTGTGKSDANPKRFEVSELQIYPIKSCGRVSVDRAVLERHGLKHDREYAICVRAETIGGPADWAKIGIWEDNAEVNAEYLCVSARELPKLLLIQPKIAKDKGNEGLTEDSYSEHIILSAPPAFKLPELAVKGTGTMSRTTCLCWDASVEAVDMGDEASAWLANFFKIAHKGRQKKPGDYPYSCANADPEKPGVLRLMKFVHRENAESSSLQKSVGAGRFADDVPVLVASEATKQAIWKAAWGEKNKESSLVTGRRFRWNILIGDANRHDRTPSHRAFIEDEISSAIFFERVPNNNNTEASVAGELEFVSPCPRCVMPTTNPETGERDGHKVTGALKTKLGRTAGAMAEGSSYWNWLYKKRVQKSRANAFYLGMNAAIKGASWDLGGGRSGRTCDPDAEVSPFEVFVGQVLRPVYGVTRK